MRTPAAAHTVWDAIRRHGYVLAAGSVVLATAVFVPLRDLLGREQWGWPYLLVLGFVAGTAGVGPAVLSAVLAFFAWNFFFIPPFHTLFVAERGDLVHLVVFLVVGVAVGLQTGRLRDREVVAQREERHAAALNRLSASLVSETSTQGLAAAAGEELEAVAGAHTVALWVPDSDGGTLTPVSATHAPDTAPPQDVTRLWRAMVAEPAAQGDRLVEADASLDMDARHRPRLLLPLVSAESAEGVLEIALDAPLSETRRSFMIALAHLLAAFLQSRRLNAMAMHATAASEAECLRSAVISSVSHELKTPLASVTAAVTDLLEPDVQRGPGEVRDKLADVAEDLRRLDDAIADLLDASRFEAQAWQPRPDLFEIGEVVGAVVARLPRAARERVDFAIPEGLPMLHLDFNQISRALHHVVGNALEYSDDMVTIGAQADGVLLLWIDDAGPGISEAEKDFVFDKFYRGQAGRSRRSSTGLGLSITREILKANDGSITIENRTPRGTRVLIRLPVRGEDT